MGVALCRIGGPVELGCTPACPTIRPSLRTADVTTRFGLTLPAEPTAIAVGLRVTLGPGEVVLLYGPSGSGKSTLLAELHRRFPGGCLVQRIRFPQDVAIVDWVAPSRSLAEAIAIMTACGLGDANLWLRPFSVLSEGERFRARLARAVSLHNQAGVSAPLLCDEFCSGLHTRAAKALSYTLGKIARQRGLCVILASSRDDVIRDLQPTTLVNLDRCGRSRVEHCGTRASRPLSLRRRVRIELGGKRDYDAFSSMHYRPSGELGFVDKVFVMRDGVCGELLGIVVYSHPPLELALRNEATGGVFSRRPTLLNRSMRIVRRLVIHPDVRGCGLGHYLVRKTLPLVGTEYVECLAGMGEFNPVFEKAGMKRIGQCQIPTRQRAALEELRLMDINPAAREFVGHVCRQRRVRQIVSRAVGDWYAATTGGGDRRVARQSPILLAQLFRGLVGLRPVYYLWRRRGRRASSRLQRGAWSRGDDA